MEDLQDLAAEYRRLMPLEEEPTRRHLATLCFHVNELVALSKQVKPSNDPVVIALNAAVAFALGHVLRSTREMVIAAAAKAPT
jgi:hypothetical protein